MRDFRSSCQGSWQFLLHNFLKDMQVKTTHLKTAKKTYKIKVLAELMWSSQPAASAQEVFSLRWDAFKHDYWRISQLQYLQSSLTYLFTVEVLMKLRIQSLSSECTCIDCQCWQCSTFYVNVCKALQCHLRPGCQKKLLSDQTQKMIKVTCQWSAVNADLSVEKVLRSWVSDLIIWMAWYVIADPAVTDNLIKLADVNLLDPFGLQIAPRMLKVNECILMPSTLAYAVNELVSFLFSSWNIIQQKFFIGTQIVNWLYFKIQFNRDFLNTPLSGLMRKFKTMIENCRLCVKTLNPGPEFSDLKLNPLQPHTHEGVND
jgi:hypothetical protein